MQGKQTIFWAQEDLDSGQHVSQMSFNRRQLVMPYLLCLIIPLLLHDSQNVWEWKSGYWSKWNVSVIVQTKQQAPVKVHYDLLVPVLWRSSRYPHSTVHSSDSRAFKLRRASKAKRDNENELVSNYRRYIFKFILWKNKIKTTDVPAEGSSSAGTASPDNFRKYTCD